MLSWETYDKQNCNSKSKSIFGKGRQKQEQHFIENSICAHLIFWKFTSQGEAHKLVVFLLVLQRVIKVRSAFNVIRLLDYHEKEKHQQS